MKNKMCSIRAFILIAIILLVSSIAVADNIFVENGGTIYKFDTQGNRTIFASGAGNCYGLAVDRSGNLFTSDWGNGTIYKFDPSGNRTLFASGFGPLGLTCDKNGNLFASYWADYRGNGPIYEFDSSGNRTTFSTMTSYSFGLAFDSSGNLFASNYGNGKIYKFDSNGNRTTFASNDNSNGFGALAFDSSGCLFATDPNFNRIVKFDSLGNKTIFASIGYGGQGTLAFDNIGNLFTSYGNAIYKFDLHGNRTTFASDMGGLIAIQSQVPEPATLLLLGLGAVVLRTKFLERAKK